MGRPSTFSQEIVDAICGRIAAGETLRQVCRDDEMPAQSTVFLWLQKHPEFSEQYVRARESLMDCFADEIVDIAEDGSNDWMLRQTKDGESVEVLNREAIERSRIRIDARKWLMGKCAPKKYGDKLQLAGDGGGPIKSESKVDLSDLTPEERDALRPILERRLPKPDSGGPGA
jgi:hypothetical protein